MGKKAEKGLSTVGAVAEAPPKDGSDGDWEAHQAHDTLLKASEHMADEGMMERVRKVAGRKAKAAQGMVSLLAQKPKFASLKDVKAHGKAMREKKLL